MPFYDGSDLTVGIGGKDVAGDTSCTVQLSRDIIEYSVKGQEGKGADYGHKQARITGETLVSTTPGTDGLDDLVAAYDAGTKVTAASEIGNRTLSGTFCVASIEFNQPDGEKQTASYELVSDGDFTVSANA